MSVHVTHLILESLGDSNNQVVDKGLNSTQSSDILARAMVHLDVNNILVWVGEANRKVLAVLHKLAYTIAIRTLIVRV